MRVLETGGTIASVGAAEGLRPVGGLQTADLHALLGVETEEVFTLSSAAIGLPQIASLHGRINAAEREGVNGVVVTHGTDTLAETAFVLTLLRRESRFPVVLTGAMRAPGQPGCDAASNLGDAVTVARSGVDLGVGVVVVFDGDVLPGLTVQKISSTSLAAFAVPGGGPIAQVVEGRVVVRARACLELAPADLDPASAGPVALVGAMPGDDGSVLLACVEHVRGVVVAGLGGGHVAPQMMDAVARLAGRLPLVVTTGPPAGPALRDTYGGPGSERSLATAGAITGWSLGPRKAALALSLCLGRTADLGRIRRTMDNDLKGAST